MKFAKHTLKSLGGIADALVSFVTTTGGFIITLPLTLAAPFSVKARRADYNINRLIINKSVGIFNNEDQLDVYINRTPYQQIPPCNNDSSAHNIASYARFKASVGVAPIMSFIKAGYHISTISHSISEDLLEIADKHPRSER